MPLSDAQPGPPEANFVELQKQISPRLEVVLVNESPLDIFQVMNELVLSCTSVSSTTKEKKVTEALEWELPLSICRLFQITSEQGFELKAGSTKVSHTNNSLSAFGSVQHLVRASPDAIVQNTSIPWPTARYISQFFDADEQLTSKSVE